MLVLAAVLALSSAAHAALLHNVPITLTQPNESVINCLASGHEYCNWAQDEEGYVIIQHPATGYWMYAELMNGEVVPSGYVAGTVDPESVGLVPNIMPPAHMPEHSSAAPSSAANPIRVGFAPQTGTLNNIMIFIRFADQGPFPDLFQTYLNLCNDTTPGANSIQNYFWETSYNSLNVTTGFYPVQVPLTVISYQDSQPRAYYAPYNSVSNPIGYTTDRQTREHTLLANAANAISSQVPPSLNVDGDGDGMVDNVCFVIQGQVTPWSTLLWPHYWQLSSQQAYINGSRVWGYTFQLSSWITTSVFCHEMTHSLGAPDLYRYVNQNVDPADSWDLMCYNTSPPEYTCAYMKNKYLNRWLPTIPEITSSGTYTLNPLTSPTGNCYKIASPNSTTEYFVVEYRQQTGTFESSLPGSGLLVYRVNPTVWGNGYGPPDEVYLYRPGVVAWPNNPLYLAYFSSDVNRTAINDTTDPASLLSNGSPGGLNISNVTSAGSTISFDVTLPTPTGEELINVDVRTTPVGVVTSLPNRGTLGGTFDSGPGTVRVERVGNVKAIVFTGSNWLKSSFNTPASLTGPPAYTVAAWVYNGQIDNEECYLSWSHRGGPGGSNCQMNYGTNADYGAVSHWDWRDMGWGAWGPPAAGQWHHLAVTYDGTTENLYADGALVGSEIKSINLYANLPVYLGCALEADLKTTSIRFSGALANVRVLNAAVDESVITDWAQEPLPRNLAARARGFVRDPGGSPIYNACVQVGGYLGQAVITGADGAFDITNCPSGQVEVYADALGYAPDIATRLLTQNTLPFTITLVPRAETGAIVNGAFENQGAGGPSTAAGWQQWVDAPGGFDFLGIPWPAANSDMYLGFRETANNQTPGGTANGFNNTGVPHPYPGIEGINTQGPQGGSTNLTSNTMTDASATWTVNAYSGWTLVMSRAAVPGFVRRYRIASNTASTVTIQSGNMLADGVAAGDNYSIVTYNYRYWYACFLRQFINVDPASKYNFYFKGNWDHNRGYTDPVGIWVFKWESKPGTEISGWVDPRSWIWYDSPGWQQYLQGVFGSGNGDRGPMLRMTPPAGAKNIEIIFGYFAWTQDPALTGRMLIDDVVVDRVAPPSIGELKLLQDGTAVTTSAVCTLAPRDANGRVTPWFYVEDASRAAGIRIEGATPIDNVSTDDLVTFSGTLRTQATGERYIELTATPTSAPSTGIPPVGVNTKAIGQDPKLVGILVRVAGAIAQIDPNGSYFTISDGYASATTGGATTVRFYGVGNYKLSAFSVGSPVTVTGVVSKESTGQSAILYRDIATPYFATGFEPQEGYRLGPIDGQQGWRIGWDPKNQGLVGATVSSVQTATGSQALMLDVWNKYSEPWWNTGFSLLSPNPIMPDRPLQSTTVQFNIWRDAGALDSNEFYWYPLNRYTDYGNDAVTSLVHALVNNTTPRTYGDPGWPEIANAWVPVTITDDYVNKTRTVVYNGVVVANNVPIATWADRAGTGFEIFYNSRNPGPMLGQPTYIDDLRISWQ